MIGYYNYTVILTYIGTISGFVGIVNIWNENLKIALICLMISGFCDMFDGKIASTMKRTKQEKCFGIQIDSLSDLICFGVLPALIGLHCTGKGILHIAVSAILLLCALIRLAWFNVDEQERQAKEEGSRQTMMGLPVTTTALLFPIFASVGQFLKPFPAEIMTWLQVAVAVSFLLPIRFDKPRLIGKLVMLALGIAGFILVMVGVRV